MARMINFFDNASSSTVPTVGDISASDLVTYANDAAFEADNSGSPKQGNIYYNTTDNKIKYYNNSAWVELLDSSITAADIANVPAGNIASTDLQTTVNELDAEKVSKSGDTISGNLIITGNLDIQGTTTTVDTTNLEVADKNININNGGSDASSEGSGLNVERTGTDGSLVYEDALASKWKAGAVGSEKEILDVSSSQVITEKDIDGGTASNTNRITLPQDTTTNLDLLTDKEATIAYDSTLNSLVVNDGAGWNELTGAASASAGINYVINQDFEEGVGDITTTTNTSVSAETTNKLRGTQSLKITIDTLADVADYVDFDLNTFHDQDTDESKDIIISFDINSSNVNYTSDDVQFVLRDVTNSTNLSISNDDDGLIKSTTGNNKFVGVAQTVAGVTDYKLRMIVLNNPTTDSELILDTIKVGPDTFGPSIRLGNKIRYTTSASTTNPSIAIGATEILDFDTTDYDDKNLVTTGASWSYAAAIAGKHTINSMIYYNAAAWTFNGFIALYLYKNGAIYCRLDTDHYQGVTASSAFRYLSGSADIELAAGDTIDIRTEHGEGAARTISTDGQTSFVEITEPETKGNLISTQEANYMTAKTRAYIDNDQAITTATVTKVQLDTTNFDTLNSFDPTTNYEWVAPQNGIALVNGDIRFQGNATGIRVCSIYLNGSEYAKGALSPSNTNVMNVGTTTFIEVSKGDTIDMRAYQDSGGNLNVEGDATGTQTELNVAFLPDFKTFGVYKNDELVESSDGTYVSFPIAVGAWGDLTSISLGAGEWDIIGVASFKANAAVTTTAIQLAISETAGTSTPDVVNGLNRADGQKTQTSSSIDSINVPRYNLTLNSESTIYLKARAVTSITDLQSTYYISARRIK